MRAALEECIIDGEVCAVGANGLPSFAGLTDALSAKRTGGLVYYVFDMMAGDGAKPDARAAARRARPRSKRSSASSKALTRKRFSYVDHESGDGNEMHEAACQMGLKGIVSKRIDAPYQPDDRSGIWTKAKCRASQELVVGGWKTTGSAFRSLIGRRLSRRKVRPCRHSRHRLQRAQSSRACCKR